MLYFRICALLVAAGLPVLSPAVQQAGPADKAAAPAAPAAPPAPAVPPAAPAPPTVTPPGVAPAVDPEAIAALGRMGAYLRTLRSFEVAGRTTTENVMDDGFKLQFDGRTSLKVRRPDRLRVDISSDRKQRQLFYDGKSLTVFGQRVKYYATVPAPPTLRETIEVLTKKYGIELPLADLFYWGTEEAPVSDVKVAHYIGPATVDGKPADQYAFRQEGVDWQLWMQQGAKPLPLKLAITSTGQPGAPTYTAMLRWTLAATFKDADFVFTPPKGAMKIAMQTADGKVVSFK